MTILRRWGWLPLGFAVAAVLAASFATKRAWMIVGTYALFNALGTAHVLRITTPEPGDTPSGARFLSRSRTAVKVSFVLQLPLGLLLFMLEGL